MDLFIWLANACIALLYALQVHFGQISAFVLLAILAVIDWVEKTSVLYVDDQRKVL